MNHHLFMELDRDLQKLQGLTGPDALPPSWQGTAQRLAQGRLETLLSEISMCRQLVEQAHSWWQLMEAELRG